MRILRLISALPIVGLLLPCIQAQNAVLVLSPAPTVSVRAGTGSAGFRGDGANAAAAQLASPSAMARDAQGNLYLADTRNQRIRRIAADGTITTVAGTGSQGFGGDEGPATQAQLDNPSGIAVAGDGTIYIADTHNHRVRHIDSAGIMHTVAGTGVPGLSGDGAAATAARLSSPAGLACGLTGDLYIADAANHRIRHIDANGTIATVAGDGVQGTSPDGTQAIAAHLDAPASVSVRPDGSVLIADRGNNRILILQTDGTLRTLGTANVALRRPMAVATNKLGDTLIADTGNFRVAQITSNGAGTALGSGSQGALDTAAAPALTPLGATASVLDTTPGSGLSQFSAIDRDTSRVVQVELPQLTFADTVVSTSSTPQNLLLRNAGTASLSVAGLSIASPFSVAGSTCGSAPFQLAAGHSCSLALVFTPQTVGAASSLVEVGAQDVPPQRLTLTGNGLPAGTELTSSTSLQSNASLSYAGVPLVLTAAVLGSSSAAATGTVTFLDGSTVLGTGALNPAAQASMTTSSLTSGAHTLVASYNGDASYLASTSAGMPITIAVPPDFTMTAPAGTQLSLHSGNPGTLSVTLQPVNGVLNQAVNIAVSGLPSGSAINVTPVPVMLASAPVAVSIAFKLPVSLSRNRNPGLWLALLVPLLCVRPRRTRSQVFASILLLCIPLLLQGCGGGYLSGNRSTAAQSAASTYPVTVTASCTGVTGATVTHSTTFTLVVQ